MLTKNLSPGIKIFIHSGTYKGKHATFRKWPIRGHTMVYINLEGDPISVMKRIHLSSITIIHCTTPNIHTNESAVPRTAIARANTTSKQSTLSNAPQLIVSELISDIEILLNSMKKLQKSMVG